MAVHGGHGAAFITTDEALEFLALAKGMGDQGETENGSEVGSLKTNSSPARASIAWSSRGDGPSTPIAEFFNSFSKAR